MKSIDKSKECEKYLQMLGKSCVVKLSDGSEENILAVVQQVWRKSKSKFESTATKIGRTYNDYYIYIGPATCDITSLGENDILSCAGEDYFFVRTERVVVGDTVQFYTGVLKHIFKEDEDVFG